MMNKKIILNLVFMFAIFTLVSHSSYAMSHYACLNEGESLASGWTCTSQCCSNICVNDNFYQTNPSSCYGLPSCSCSGSNNIDNDLTPPNVTINEPEQDHAYSSRSVPFEISLNEVAYRLEYQEKGQERRGWVRLCPGKCVSYSGRRTFNDGEHTLNVRAIDGNGNIGDSTVSFFVDSLAPRIKMVLPSNNDYCNGKFTIDYVEANVVSISLFYKDSSMDSFEEVSKDDCSSGSNEECSFDVDSLAQGNLEYYFTITDKSQTVESKHQSVVVDSVAPDLNVVVPENKVYSNGRIQFNINTDELSDLSYLDEKDKKPREKALCRNCLSYERTQSFKDGDHKIVIIARDLAGNEINKTISFTVDSKAPRILQVEPSEGSYGNGDFSISYNEDNVVSISLFYKDSSMDSFKKVKKDDCPSGSNEECSFEVDSLAQGKLEYYFTITDKAQTVESKHQNVVVDSVAPNLNVVLPENKVYSNGRIQFSINTDELSSLSYLDEKDKKPREKILCRNCLSYERTQSFSDGDHKIWIIARDLAGNEKNTSVEFTVDSKAPRILRTEPRERSYGNGIFSVSYNEMSPVRVTLYYSYDDVNFQHKDNLNCPSGSRAYCEIKVDDIHQGDVYYYFEIEDIARNIVGQRRETKVVIDTILPDLHVFSPLSKTYNGRRILFNLTSDETVTFEYKNLNSISPRWKTLRSRTMAYQNSRYFTYGDYDLLIRAIDLAGNSEEKKVTFQVAKTI